MGLHDRIKGQNGQPAGEAGPSSRSRSPARRRKRVKNGRRTQPTRTPS